MHIWAFRLKNKLWQSPNQLVFNAPSQALFIFYYFGATSWYIIKQYCPMWCLTLSLSCATILCNTHLSHTMVQCQCTTLTKNHAKHRQSLNMTTGFSDITEYLTHLLHLHSSVKQLKRLMSLQYPLSLHCILEIEWQEIYQRPTIAVCACFDSTCLLLMDTESYIV